MIEGYIARVVNKLEEEDCVEVVLLGTSMVKEKVRILHSRANPLYGVAGNLPDIGELGIVLRLPAYSGDFFWIGSFHDPVENICTPEVGKILFHHESDVWYRLGEDGTVEISHPSGTYLKIGTDTTLSQRTRNKKQTGKSTLSEQVNYNPCSRPPVNLFLRHTWKEGTITEDTCFNDKRKKTVTGGTIKNTDIKLDDAGNIEIIHDVNKLVLNIDKDGNLSVTASGTVKVDASTIELNGNTGNVVTTECICSFTGTPHPQGSLTVKAGL